MTETNEQYEFGVEVPQLMSMFINSVYSSKDMFLREAISNASDALTKFFDLKTKFDEAGLITHMYGDLKIEIIPDFENNTLIIRDNGIGMTKDDLRNFLGNIAASGTAKFREALNKKEDVEALIGQFGLGFYSLFLVASQVDVITKNPRDCAYLWSSTGQTGYTIKETEVDAGFLHGTTIYLRLKEGEEEFLKTDKLIELIKKHSMYIQYPIYVETEVTKKTEETKEGEKEDDEVKEVKEDDKETEEKKVEETKVKEMKKVNTSDVHVWKKKVQDVSKEDLQKFYTHISKDCNEFLAVESFHFEGIVDVKLLLFIPKKQPMNFFEKPAEKARNIKIYNNNVFITDELTREIVPEWMDFVYGAVTSSDFSLNISREFLQGKTALNILKKKMPKCIATLIKNAMVKNSEAITSEFGKNIKQAVQATKDGVQEDFAKFLRYPTNQDKKLISLDEYLSKVDESEKVIYYLTGLNQKDVENSIYLDAYKDKTVLLMSEVHDEIMLQGFKEYKGMSLQNISSEPKDNKDAEVEEEFKEFVKKIEEILNEKIEKVVVSRRYKSLPATLLTSQFACSNTMESILKINSMAENNLLYQMALKAKKILEINPENEFIQSIKKEFDAGNEDKFKELVLFLHKATIIGCGYPSDDNTGFIRKLFELVK